MNLQERRGELEVVDGGLAAMTSGDDRKLLVEVMTEQRETQ